jgi:hypothetical protein
MLTVTTAATDRSLLTPAELRSAANQTDGSRDTELATLGNRVAAAIARSCNVATDGVTPATLRYETLTETLRPNEQDPFCYGPLRRYIILSRRPVVSVTSIVEDGTTLDAEDYEIDAASGRILRLEDDEPAYWLRAKIVVVYTAGWQTVPDDLKLAASKLAQLFWADSLRSDPNLRSEEIPGVITRSWWVSQRPDPLLPEDIDELLAPYKNKAIG